MGQQTALNDLLLVAVAPDQWTAGDLVGVMTQSDDSDLGLPERRQRFGYGGKCPRHGAALNEFAEGLFCVFFFGIKLVFIIQLDFAAESGVEEKKMENTLNKNRVTRFCLLRMWQVSNHPYVFYLLELYEVEIADIKA